jgi:hypothetical protein
MQSTASPFTPTPTHCALRALVGAAFLLSVSAPAIANEWASCVRELRTIAIGKGIDAQVFDTALAGVEPDADILKAFDNQPEFTIPIWDYLAGLVDDERVADGRALMEKWAAILAQAGISFTYQGAAVTGVWSASRNAFADFEDQRRDDSRFTVFLLTTSVSAVPQVTQTLSRAGITYFIDRVMLDAEGAGCELEVQKSI